MEVAVVAAAHNRRVLTVRAFVTAQASLEAAGAKATFWLFDDGSTDGTADAVRALPFPVEVVTGDGSAFWARGMSLAEARALEGTGGGADALIWLNDDVAVDEDAFPRLIELSRARQDAILVGSVREEDGAVSYSGYVRNGPHPLRLRQLLPGTEPVELDAFNGNIVLVPMAARRAIGAIDGGFAHQLADIDYGYRARRAGVAVLLAPGTYGECPTNPPRKRRGALADWRAFRSAKGGGHPASMRRFLRRHGGATWFVWIGVTYGLWWLRALRAAVLSRQA